MQEKYRICKVSLVGLGQLHGQIPGHMQRKQPVPPKPA